jgi:hypothetical protein
VVEWQYWRLEIASLESHRPKTLPKGIMTSALLGQIANQATQTFTQTGIGLGAAIAVVCSWERNRSILWAILAGILSWIYVIYFALTRKPEEEK